MMIAAQKQMEREMLEQQAIAQAQAEKEEDARKRLEVSNPSIFSMLPTSTKEINPHSNNSESTSTEKLEPKDYGKEQKSTIGDSTPIL